MRIVAFRKRLKSNKLRGVLIMIDIKFLRENPDVVKQNIKNKFQDEKLPLVDEVIELDQNNRDIKGEVEALRAKRNKISKLNRLESVKNKASYSRCAPNRGCALIVQSGHFGAPLFEAAPQFEGRSNSRIYGTIQ